MSKKAFDKKLEDIDALRSSPLSEATIEQLRHALTDRNNYLVSKAALVAAHFQLDSLIPALIAAFDRFFADPVKSDPQCWAKNAIVKALKDLGHRDPQVFLRGIVHVQLEPIWGGRSDTAGTLRGSCALALIDCHLGDFEILTYLTDRLADTEKTVRLDTVRAIAQLGRPEGALLLRLKTLAGDVELEVVGQCFSSLLDLAPLDSVQFVARFLEAEDDDLRAEAAGALAQSRELQAIETLRKFWQVHIITAGLRRAIVLSLAASPLREAAQFLLSIISESNSELAASAVEALAASRFRDEMREQVATVVQDKCDPKLRRLLDEKFGNAEARRLKPEG